jgi:hypothetical protein
MPNKEAVVLVEVAQLTRLKRWRDASCASWIKPWRETAA